MTRSDFIAFYPQFAGFMPEIVMSAYIVQANERFAFPSEADAEEARRLYTAHKLTMYAMGEPPETVGAGARYTYAQLAAAGQARQKIASKKAGEVAVTYSSGTSSASASAGTDLADLTETSFGLQLLALLRLYSRSVYVP